MNSKSRVNSINCQIKKGKTYRTSNHRVSRHRVWCWAAGADGGWSAGWCGRWPRRAGCRTPPRCVRSCACAPTAGRAVRAWRTDSRWWCRHPRWLSCAAPTAAGPAAPSSSIAPPASPALVAPVGRSSSHPSLPIRLNHRNNPVSNRSTPCDNYFNN